MSTEQSAKPGEVYYCDDCATFNGDSDVDGGEDELELRPDGTATREIRHRRSWLDGGGSGSDVREARQEGTWAKCEGQLRMSWQGHAPHKGAAPTAFEICSEGITLSSDYRAYDSEASKAAGKPVFKPKKRLYRRVAAKQINLQPPTES
eukprot:NODE_4633_length_655_cov_128.406667.p1 GENE.NODE_4633_length_655_cov_128.406667~~NODE_4633_length_655_cov_128.406667.p1  ORF type:complete len:149 (+),score=19.66 NODE_4633_length_655_cov_128.406667:111-557(+)